MSDFILDWITSEHSEEMYSRPKTPATLTAGEMSSGVYIDADGKTKSKVLINRPGKAILEYEVRGQETGADPKYFRFKTLPCEIVGLRENQAYNFAIKQIHARTGVSSAWGTDYAYTTAKDTTAPGVPTSLAVATVLRGLYVTWRNPSDPDLKKIQLYRSLTAEGTYNLVWEGLAEEYQDLSISYGVTYYYKVRAVDNSGNASSLTSYVSSAASAVLSDFPSSTDQARSDSYLTVTDSTGDGVWEEVAILSSNFTRAGAWENKIFVRAYLRGYSIIGSPGASDSVRIQVRGENVTTTTLLTITGASMTQGYFTAEGTVVISGDPSYVVYLGAYEGGTIDIVAETVSVLCKRYQALSTLV